MASSGVLSLKRATFSQSPFVGLLFCRLRSSGAEPAVHRRFRIKGHKAVHFWRQIEEKIYSYLDNVPQLPSLCNQDALDVLKCQSSLTFRSPDLRQAHGTRHQADLPGNMNEAADLIECIE